MIPYRPGETAVHALDPRSKLCFQVGFAIAAFARASPTSLAILTAITAVVLGATRLSPLRIVRTFRFVLFILAAPVVVAGVVVGPPWFVLERTIQPGLESYRIVLVLGVGSAYVRTTRVRDSRAAVQRHVPGRAGQLLGVGMSLTFRLFPVLLGDLKRLRTALAARLGDRRRVTDRARRIALLGLRRALLRADRLALALRARCFAWNPTLPELRFSRLDYPVTLAGVALAVWPLV